MEPGSAGPGKNPAAVRPASGRREGQCEDRNRKDDAGDGEGGAGNRGDEIARAPDGVRADPIEPDGRRTTGRAAIIPQRSPSAGHGSDAQERGREPVARHDLVTQVVQFRSHPDGAPVRRGGDRCDGKCCGDGRRREEHGRSSFVQAGSYPRETSRIIMTVKPMMAAAVGRSESSVSWDRGTSSSMTTNTMAPAANERA